MISEDGGARSFSWVVLSFLKDGSEHAGSGCIAEASGAWGSTAFQWIRSRGIGEECRMKGVGKKTAFAEYAEKLELDTALATAIASVLSLRGQGIGNRMVEVFRCTQIMPAGKCVRDFWAGRQNGWRHVNHI